MTNSTVNQRPLEEEIDAAAYDLSRDRANHDGKQATYVSSEFARFKQQLGAERESYLRLAADFENFKKRTARETERRSRGIKDAFIRELLPVIDNLERALAESGSGPTEGLKEGVKIIQNQLLSVFKAHGLEPELSLGQPFDPQRHEAVGVQSNPEFPDGAVLETWQRGWCLHGKVFRHAKVIVNQLAKSPSLL